MSHILHTHFNFNFTFSSSTIELACLFFVLFLCGPCAQKFARPWFRQLRWAPPSFLCHAWAYWCHNRAPQSHPSQHAAIYTAPMASVSQHDGSKNCTGLPRGSPAQSRHYASPQSKPGKVNHIFRLLCSLSLSSAQRRLERETEFSKKKTTQLRSCESNELCDEHRRGGFSQHEDRKSKLAS